MVKILIVEDDRALAQTLQTALQETTYQVTCAHTIKHARQYLHRREFELAIVDRVLGTEDGLELVKYMHQRFLATKVVILSQWGRLGDRLDGLHGGADEYLLKPINLTELRVRVKRLIAMHKTAVTDYLQVADMKLFPQSGHIRLGEQRVFLRRKEIEILRCLFRHKNRTVSRKMLIDWVWSGEQESPSYNTIDVYLRRIRVLLGDRRSCLKTVRGFGYLVEDKEAE